MSITLLKGIVESRINHLHFKRHIIHKKTSTGEYERQLMLKNRRKGRQGMLLGSSSSSKPIITKFFKTLYFNPLLISHHNKATSKPCYTQEELLESKTGTIGLGNTLKFNLTETYKGRVIDNVYAKLAYATWGGSDGDWRGEHLRGASVIQKVRYYQTSNSILEYERDEWELMASTLKEDARDAFLRTSSALDPDTNATVHNVKMINFWNFLEYHPARSLLVDRLSGNDVWIDLQLVSALAKIGTTTTGTVALPGSISISVIYHELLVDDHEETVEESEKDHLINYLEMVTKDFTGVAAATKFQFDLSSMQANSKLLTFFIKNETDNGNDIGLSAYFQLENNTTGIDLRNGGREIFSKTSPYQLDALFAATCETDFPRKVLFLPFCLQDPIETLDMHLGSLNHSHLEDMHLDITVNVGDTDAYRGYVISLGEAYLSYDEKGKIKIHM